MSEHITERIQQRLGVEDLSALLADEISGAELHSLLLSVFKRRVATVNPGQLAQSNPTTQASNTDAKLLNRVEQIGYEACPQFDAIELSPLTPLGAIARLTGLDQGNVLSTIRAYECASDPTIGLALECVRRRKQLSNRTDPTRLCTAQRVVRFPTPNKPGFTPHFKLWSMVSAARDRGSFSTETAALEEHLDFYLRFLSDLSQNGFSFTDIEVELSDTRVVAHLCKRAGVPSEEIRASVRAHDSGSSIRLLEKYATPWPGSITDADEFARFGLPHPLVVQMELLEQQVFGPLRQKHPSIPMRFNFHRLNGVGYYEGPCLHLKTKLPGGEGFVGLADGGFVDWTRRMLGDGKERLLTSAIGIEMICRLFRAPG